MSTIYELTDEFTTVLGMIEDGCNPDVVADTLEAIGGEIEVKADGYAKVIKQLESEIAGIKTEEERLANRRKSMENNIVRMKKSLQNAMEMTGKEKFKTDLFSFGIQDNPPSCKIEDGVVVPVRFRIPQPDKVDKKALIKALQNGESHYGVTLTQERSLRIR